MARSRLDSINEIARQGYSVRITCVGCGNVSDWNTIELMRELHRRRISLAIDEVERRVKCSSCGAHNASIQPVFTD
jgi:ribosomal protein S27E